MFFYGQTQNNNINAKFWSINVKKYTMNNDIQWLKKIYSGLLTKLQWEHAGVSYQMMWQMML
jgi:hypothetical protein